MIKKMMGIIVVCLSLIGCSNHINKVPSDVVQMPYKEWRLGGRYPNYFTADIISSYMITQTDRFNGLRIAIGPNKGESPDRWYFYSSWPDSLYVNADLPKTLYVCWVSFVDQTFYRTKIDVPLTIRQQMVIPYQYREPVTNKEVVRYNNIIILGFAPRGNVTAWIVGAVGTQWIKFAEVSSTNLGKNSENCPNPYNDGQIPEISTEAKEWLKQHGMPAHWQEKPVLNEIMN